MPALLPAARASTPITLAQRLAHIFDADECMWADLRLAEEVGSILVLGQQALTLLGPVQSTCH